MLMVILRHSVFKFISISSWFLVTSFTLKSFVIVMSKTPTCNYVMKYFIMSCSSHSIIFFESIEKSAFAIACIGSMDKHL